MIKETLIPILLVGSFAVARAQQAKTSDAKAKPVTENPVGSVPVDLSSAKPVKQKQGVQPGNTRAIPLSTVRQGQPAQQTRQPAQTTAKP